MPHGRCLNKGVDESCTVKTSPLSDGRVWALAGLRSTELVGRLFIGGSTPAPNTSRAVTRAPMHMCMWTPPLAAWRVVRLICAPTVCLLLRGLE